MAKSPPPLRHLYPRITSFPTLLAAYRKASKGKRYRPDVLAFAANLEAELFQLHHELQSFTYAPGPYRQFQVREPKPRLVSAAPFRDRVVHHALIAVIAPPLERRFLPTSYANRRGYGSHRALRRFCRACREHRWLLQADIRLYFPNIDHRLLMGQLKEVIACSGTLWLLDRSLANGAIHGSPIECYPGDNLLTSLERPRGLPIGNLTSQFLANFHLDGLRPEPLHQALVCLHGELAALRLRLHPSKTRLVSNARGASFVGFHVIGGRIRVRNHSLLRIRRGLRRCHEALLQRRLSVERARRSAQSWNAHLAQGHTIRLRQRLFSSHRFCADLSPLLP